MAKKDDVDAFMAALDHPLRAEVEAVRRLVLGADERIREGIKWNAPSFFIAEHFATFNLRRGDAVQVVFHTGAKVRADASAIEIDDRTSLLQWPAQDRAIATLRDMADVEARGEALVDIVRQWIARTQ